MKKKFGNEVDVKEKGISVISGIDDNELFYTPLTEEENNKFNPEEFRVKSIVYDIKYSSIRYKSLFTSLKYLGYSGYPQLKKGKKWGEWKLDDILKTFAQIVDSLRKLYFPISEKKDKSNYWKCYFESKKYMQTKSPKDEVELKEWNKKHKEIFFEESDKKSKSKDDKTSNNDEENDFLNVNEEKLKNVTDKKLKDLHYEAHYYWELFDVGLLKDLDLVLTNHVLVVHELIKRNLAHSASSGIDHLSQQYFPGYDKKREELVANHEEIHNEYSKNPNDLLFLQHIDSEKNLQKYGYFPTNHKDELDKYYVWHNGKNLARINSSGEVQGRNITLNEVLTNLKSSFRMRSPYIYLSGGLVNNGETSNDIEIVIQCTQSELDSQQGHLLKWRIMRMFPADLAKRIHFLASKHIGPITNNIPLFSLSCERINENDDIFEMSYDKDSFEMKKSSINSLQNKDIGEETKMDNDEIEKTTDYSDVPDENDVYKFVMQSHFKGKTEHIDFRAEAKTKKYLIGFTLDDLIDDAIKKPVHTIEQAKALLKKKDVSKIDWDTGKFKLRKTSNGNIVPIVIQTQEKNIEPSEWISVNGVIPKGMVGATKEYPGVFVVRDKGTIEYGSVKSDFKEFFVDGEKIKGRLLFRELMDWKKDNSEPDIIKLLPPSKDENIERKKTFWVAIQPIDQTPYVLSNRAIQKGWVPPKEHSCLPEKIRNVVPEGFKYWKQSSVEERIKIRDAYVASLKENKTYNEMQKSLDIAKLEAEAASFNYWVMQEFLDCDLKHVFANSVSISMPQMGNFLKAFSEVTKDYNTLDIRNFNNNGYESPPIYKVIKLNSQKEEDFLISGMRFFEDKLQRKFIVKFQPTWDGFDVTLISNTMFKNANKDMLTETFEWIKNNNYLKNEKFNLSGDFLSVPKDLSWDDIKLKKDLKDTIVRLNDSINSDGKELSRGVLMIGPPGTGKTLSCKMLMKNSNSTFIWVTAKEFSTGGVSAAFSLARELAPTILCFEDIDTYISGHCVDLFKTELDGLISNEGVCVILTTNHPEDLPLALLDRPGRFHDICNFDLPKDDTRKEMVEHFIEENISNEVLLEIIKETVGFSGAHMKELVVFAQKIQKEKSCGIDEAILISLDKLKAQKQLVADILSAKHPSKNFIEMSLDLNGEDMKKEYNVQELCICSVCGAKYKRIKGIKCEELFCKECGSRLSPYIGTTHK